MLIFSKIPPVPNHSFSRHTLCEPKLKHNKEKHKLGCYFFGEEKVKILWEANQGKYGSLEIEVKDHCRVVYFRYLFMCLFILNYLDYNRFVLWSIIS